MQSGEPIHTESGEDETERIIQQKYDGIGENALAYKTLDDAIQEAAICFRLHCSTTLSQLLQYLILHQRLSPNEFEKVFNLLDPNN